MQDPLQNPAHNANLAGKHRRHAEHTAVFRHFSSDKSTERTIITLKSWLAGKMESADVVSISLLARRALAVYVDHCSALNLAGLLDREREAVRRGSRLPNQNPRRTTTPRIRAKKSKKSLGRPPLTKAPVVA